MHLINISQPSSEPLSLSDAKTHCRIDHSADDALVTALITMARRWVENYLKAALITQNWSVFYDFRDNDCRWYSERSTIRLPMRPVQSITTITTFDDSDTATVFSNTNYRLSGDNRIVLMNGAFWPTGLRVYDCIQVDFVAGFGNAANNVPAEIVQAMKLLIAQWYENRQAINEDELNKTNISDLPPPFGVTALLQPYRTFTIG